MWNFMDEDIFEDFDLLRILFLPEVAVPMLLVLSAVFLMRRFYVLNYRSDDMRKFIAAGGNKLDDEEFRRFVRMRRLFGNALIISSLTAGGRGVRGILRVFCILNFGAYIGRR